MKLRKLVPSAAVLACAFALALPASAGAQHVILSVGLTNPIGDFGDFANLGWMAEGGVTFPVGEDGLWAGVVGSYGINNHDADVIGVTDGDKTNVLTGMGLIGYNIATEGNVAPYVWGGAGILVHRFVPEVGDSESDSNFGFQAGVGVSIGAQESDVHPYVEVRFEGASETQFIGANAGVAISVG